MDRAFPKLFVAGRGSAGGRSSRRFPCFLGERATDRVAASSADGWLPAQPETEGCGASPRKKGKAGERGGNSRQDAAGSQEKRGGEGENDTFLVVVVVIGESVGRSEGRSQSGKSPRILDRIRSFLDRSGPPKVSGVPERVGIAPKAFLFCRQRRDLPRSGRTTEGEPVGRSVATVVVKCDRLVLYGSAMETGELNTKRSAFQRAYQRYHSSHYPPVKCLRISWFFSGHSQVSRLDASPARGTPVPGFKAQTVGLKARLQRFLNRKGKRFSWDLVRIQTLNSSRSKGVKI